jgi:TRAP-type C4-dicarboxylate transport system permease small subunit
MLSGLRRGLEHLLELVVVLLVVGLSALIIAGFLFRYSGRSLTWYDEVASVGLAWLTYYGSALAALKGAHIGFPGIVNALPRGWRVAATAVSEACIFLFFGLLAWTGLEVVRILEGSTLVSLPSVSLQLTQSVIPIGALLFMLAEALRLPLVFRAARETGFIDHEIEEVLGEVRRTETLGPVAAPSTPTPDLEKRPGHRPRPVSGAAQ